MTRPPEVHIWVVIMWILCKELRLHGDPEHSLLCYVCSKLERQSPKRNTDPPTRPTTQERSTQQMAQTSQQYQQAPEYVDESSQQRLLDFFPFGLKGPKRLRLATEYSKSQNAPSQRYRKTSYALVFRGCCGRLVLNVPSFHEDF